MTAETDRKGRQTQARGGGERPGGQRTAGQRPGAPRPGASRAVKKALRRTPVYEKSHLALGRANYLLIAAGVACAVVGFALLREGNISLAPVLIVLGYCGLVPAGLLIEHVAGRKRTDGPGGPTEGE